MRNLKMRKVAKEIIGFKIPKATLNSFKKKFYQIMRDNNIKEGEWNSSGSSRLISNPEWVMCKTLFLDSLRRSLDFPLLFDTPDDLMAYGEQPQYIAEVFYENNE
ncbi:hypothetical protein LCGC14_3118350 [marine sediment metagenome]|uniref:Uncharacterized protein n=1 Tax=marine sediment metagenome TaxID=412755 RepID=A0A0F8W2Z7_9ZZZZ